MKKGWFMLSLVLILLSCGSSKKNNPVPVLPPVAAVLSAPAQNAVCITGTVVSGTQSSVQFSWAASANTDSYDLVLKNLLTSASTTQSTATAGLTVTLNQNTPYAWYIMSKSGKTSTTAESDTWKFYNSGPGVVTYPPYPAEITSPTYGQKVSASAGTVNLTWTGSSVASGTIVNYDVYFGTTTIPAILKSDVTGSFLNNVSITSGITYYWKVITRDNAGNTSDSGVYQFTVN
jgi:hypothetical protein